jgi:hypothetical protein
MLLLGDTCTIGSNMLFSLDFLVDKRDTFVKCMSSIPSVTLSMGLVFLFDRLSRLFLRYRRLPRCGQGGGMFIRVSFVLSRMCEVSTRDVVFVLALFCIFSFFFLMISTIVFCIRGSFVVIDCG